MKGLIIPWKRQILYWVFALAFSATFLWMDTSITL